MHFLYLFSQSFIDSAVEQSIVNIVTFVITVAINIIQTRHKEEILALREIIKESLLLRDFFSSTSFSNSNTSSKALFLTNFQLKAINRWNQLNLGNFNLHLNRKVHDEGKIVLVGKNIYYRNVLLFVQLIQNLATFKDIALVKVNIPNLLRGSALEWYTSELIEFNHDALNNNLGIKSQINTLSQRFKVSTNMALGLFIDKIYSLNNAQRCHPPVQYV